MVEYKRVTSRIPDMQISINTTSAMSLLQKTICTLAFYLVVILCLAATSDANKLHKLFGQEEDSREEFREGVRRVMTPLMALAVVLKLVFEK
ncbi:hypothetical protein TNCT_286021 [Trichonephila clavata]|uniref:Uncharacterized protein n=1 Tax=Trichonephila clavata TaxID=2740835 RepID=A0A8X6L0X9_TRICU|nr:hypothetical protein TNCT_286021 [Trichonephila clavata]